MSPERFGNGIRFTMRLHRKSPGLINYQPCSFKILKKGAVVLILEFGNTLKALRISHGYSQQQLGAKIGVSQSSIKMYENMQRLPPLDVVVNMAKIFNVSVDFMLGVENTRNLVDLTGLSENEIKIMKDLIKAMKESKIKK